MDAIFGVNDPTKFVSHYTKIETALKYILPKHSLLLGSFAKTNDPKETKIWEFSPGSNEGTDLSKYSIPELSKAFTAALKDCAKVICFCSDRSPLVGDPLRDIFNRGFAKPRMWAQYAKDHSGVCLVFDRSELHQQISKATDAGSVIVNANVTYTNRAVLPDLSDGTYMINVDALREWGTRKYAAEHLKRFHRRLFFEKKEDWRDEEEFRWVVWEKTANDLYVDYGTSLKAVIFGENIRPDLAEQVMVLTQNQNIVWQALKWKNCSPWYDFGNLRYDRNIRKSGGW